MDQKKKNLILFIGAIFIALIFLSSYAAFSNNNTSNASTSSTVKPAETHYATGNTNAVITNYSDIVNVTLSNNSNATTTALQNILSKLESNGSISNYIYANNNYEVVLLGMDASTLKQSISNQANSTIPNNTIHIGSTATVMLPAGLVLYYSGSPENVYLTSRNYSVYLNNIKSIGTSINVSVSALLERNGSIYNNEVRIAYNP